MGPATSAHVKGRGSPSVGGWGAVVICWGRGVPEIAWSVCAAVVGASCWSLGAAEEGTPLVKGRRTRRLPAAVGLRCLRLPDGLAHPSRSAWAPGAGVDVEVRPARRGNLWPYPVCERSWPQSWQYWSCMAASCVVVRFTSE
jgi:hypothetical protein